MEGAWPYFVPEGWQNHPWTSDWYKLQPWEAKTGHDFYWNAGVRRYGGDLQGVIDKLDYLQNLGITAIYLNPVFESPSLHKYDASMYHHIDNNFGPAPDVDREMWSKENPADPATWQWTPADKLFLKLISESHKRGMKIIIDGVFNHTGTQFWAFKDIVKNQQNSKYKDWYTINSWDDSAKGTKFDYAGWYGVKDLPEIREDSTGLVKGPREHIHDIVKRWMDPNGDGDPSDGIDGWRLDVAEQVNHNFWKNFKIACSPPLRKNIPQRNSLSKNSIRTRSSKKYGMRIKNLLVLSQKTVRSSFRSARPIISHQRISGIV
jgi:glycosidase